MNPVLVFDIETVPDVAAGRRLYQITGLSDGDTARAMQHLRLQAKGTDFLPHHLQRVVAISVALRRGDEFKVWSLGDVGAGEAELIRRFFEGIEKYRPTLVSWNGSGFDLPVLHYRAMLHKVQAPAYWDTGHFNKDSKWDSYIGRYQFRHTDVMDVLALYQARACAPLDEVAQLLGYPGKLGMDGSKVWDAYQAGELPSIRNYCETDVLNTYLVYLRFQHMRGLLSDTDLATELSRARTFVKSADSPHWREFAAAWSEE